MEQVEDHVRMKGAAEWNQMLQNKLKKRQVKINDCGLLCVSLTVPCSQLMFVNPVANDAGHLYDVGQVM